MSIRVLCSTSYRGLPLLRLLADHRMHGESLQVIDVAPEKQFRPFKNRKTF